MPNRDGTGPNGQGPLSGRGFGGCEGGKGFSRNRMYCRRPLARTLQLSKEEKIKVLKAEKECIEQELEALE